MCFDHYFVYNYFVHRSVCEVVVCLCVSVCLSARISLEPWARSLPICMDVAYGRGSIILQQGDEIPRGRDNFGVFFPNDNALYSITFGTHTNWLNRWKCRLGWWMGLDRGTVCYVGVTILPNFLGNICLTILILLIIANRTGTCSGTRSRQTFDCKHWTSLLSAAKWAV